MDKKLVWSS